MISWLPLSDSAEDKVYAETLDIRMQDLLVEILYRFLALEEISSGGYYWSAQGTAAVAVAGTYVKVSTADSTTSIRAENFTIDANNRATYTGALTRTLRVSYSVTIHSEDNNETLSFKIAKNDTVIDGSESHAKFATGTDETVISVEYFVELATNEYVELWATNVSNVGDAIVHTGTCIITRE